MGLIQKVPSDITDYGILRELQDILEWVAPDLDAASAIPGKLIVDDLHLDDLGVVEMVVAAEDRFGIKITDEETMHLIRFGTVGDAVRCISKHLSK